MKSSNYNLVLPTLLTPRRGLFFLLLFSLLLYSKPALPSQNINHLKNISYKANAYIKTSKTRQAYIILRHQRELDLTNLPSLPDTFALSRADMMPHDKKRSTEVIFEAGERSPPINTTDM